MSTVFNPLFQVYNQAITDQDRGLQVTSYIHNDDDTKVLTQAEYDRLPGGDKEYDYSYSSTGPVSAAQEAKYSHRDAITQKVATIPPTQTGSLNLASLPQDDRYRLEGVAPAQSRSNSKGKLETTHTMGDYLSAALKEFDALQLKNANFWEWVKAEISKDSMNAAKRWNPKLYGAVEQRYHHHLVQWFATGVKYISETQARDRYKVAFRGGLLYRLLSSTDNEPVRLDKQEVVKQFTKKGNPAGSLIWVFGSGSFYSHMAKVGRFHHSSFFAGDTLSAAGEWDVKDGKLIWISGQSGHYRPGFDFLKDAVKALPNDVLSSAKIRVFKQKTPFDMTPENFLKETSQGLIGMGFSAFST